MLNTEPESLTKVVHVAVAVIERLGDSGEKEILIAQRAKCQHQGGLWEFPGGKVEHGESVLAALARELQEEINISPLANIPPEPMIKIQHDYGDKQVLLDVWRVSKFSGEPRGLEGQPLRWVALTDLAAYAFPAANIPILNACRLPHRYVITPEYVDLKSACRYLDTVRQHGTDLVRLRMPTLTQARYEEFALALLRELGGSINLMLSHLPESAALLDKACGVHLARDQARRFTTRPVPKDKLFAVSCHDADELMFAQELGADFVTLSPVCPTSSHPGAQVLGWERFSKLLELNARIPVFALGGMSLADEPVARRFGAQGIAGISCFT